MVMPLEVPLLYKIVLAILGFFDFTYEVDYCSFKSVKNCVGILMWIALNL